MPFLSGRAVGADIARVSMLCPFDWFWGACGVEPCGCWRYEPGLNLFDSLLAKPLAIERRPRA